MSGSCARAGYSDCCEDGSCLGDLGDCSCDEFCYNFGDCCTDISDTCSIGNNFTHETFVCCYITCLWLSLFLFLIFRGCLGTNQLHQLVGDLYYDNLSILLLVTVCCYFSLGNDTYLVFGSIQLLSRVSLNGSDLHVLVHQPDTAILGVDFDYG